MDIKNYLESKERQTETKGNRPDFSNIYGSGSTKTIGQQFVTSEAYKSFIENGRNSSDNVPINTKALTSTTLGGHLLSNLPVYGKGEQPLTLRNLLAVAPTDSNAVDYIMELGFTNAAAIAPETTLKGESGISYEVVTSLVKTIAHWLPVTRQVIADSPSISNHIDMRLMYGLAVTEEAQILYGNGTGDNLLGLMVNSGVQNYTPVAGDSKVDVIRKAMSLTYIAGFPPTGVVVHPTDWEEMEISKGTDGHYIFANVNTGGETRLWRVPVVLSTAITKGSFLTGAFGLGAQLFDREQANIRVSEHHADYFTKNMLAILAEQRLALATYRPEAFVKGTFIVA